MNSFKTGYPKLTQRAFFFPYTMIEVKLTYLPSVLPGVALKNSRGDSE